MRIVPITVAAEYVGLSTVTLGRYARQGKCPSFRVGSRVLFDLNELERWVRSQAVSSTQGQVAASGAAGG